MVEIDWYNDYKGEFICQRCNQSGMCLAGKNKNRKQKFRCSSCGRQCYDSCQINIQAVADPVNPELVWYTDHKIFDFVCPNCQARELYFRSIDQRMKRVLFTCRKCLRIQRQWLELSLANVSKFGNRELFIQTFDFNKDEWDLRAINPDFDMQDIIHSITKFCSIYPEWFKQETKNYTYHLCKNGTAFGTIAQHLKILQNFSRYLNQTNIASFSVINRSLVLDYLAQQKHVSRNKLGALRSFFTTGNVKGWFNIDLDIIRDEDYPKEHRGNPDPISDRVREQIEQNLHKIPDPIARMWIICYFAAMRPSELALLKQNCLVQEGEHWKLIWHRKKGKDYHEVPISRTIAKVVQEQKEYIQDLWKDEWEYLFCHYNGLSETDPQSPKLKPLKKIIPTTSNPLVLSIRCLIQANDICDENGQLAKFSPKLLRSTRLTQLFEQGHDLSVVSAWAGHKHLDTTSIYYTAVSCALMEREAGHIQQALVNSNGHQLPYESLPKSFWKTPQAHKIELSGTHINTPIYGFCGLPLDQDCRKFRACYTCGSFVAVPEKLSQYILTRDALRAKESQALANGQDVLFEQFGRQAEQLDLIITGLQGAT